MAVSRSQIFLDTSLELLQLGYGVRFRAGGRSMRPTIRDGEMITIEPVRPIEIKLGDIVLYQFKKGVIAHRVVRIERDERGALFFILRGDRSLSCDERVKQDEILGRVVSLEREGRSIDLTSNRAKLLSAARVCTLRLKARAYSMLKSKELSA